MAGAHGIRWVAMVVVAAAVSTGFRLLARWQMRRTDARLDAALKALGGDRDVP